jgi:cephalosporin-C deacetylase-like acetyl esterase
VSFRGPDKKNIIRIAGAAYSPLKIEPSLPVPGDFDTFWAGQKKLLAQIPLDPEMTPVKYNSDEVECFDVQVKCTIDAPVSGYFARPVKAAAKSLPIVLWVHGAGVRSSSLGNAVKGAVAGMLSMDINAHGLPNGKPAKFYREQSAGPLKNYRHAGRESREMVYFRGMYLRLVRAIDFLTSQPEWDGKTVAVIGHSQGGGQALVAGGIDERVTFIASGVPAICDHSGRAAGRINGWPKIVPTGPDGKPDPTILRATRYIDAVNFASRCKADAIMSVGFIDAVCPPSSCYAAYNALQGKKSVINEPLMGHAAPGHIQTAFFDAIVKHAKRDLD